jgi:hypothetical protein
MWNILTSLCSNVTNNVRRSREIKSSIATAKSAFNKKKTLVTSKLDSNLGKKLVNCYIYMIVFFCGAETLALRKVDYKYLESF